MGPATRLASARRNDGELAGALSGRTTVLMKLATKPGSKFSPCLWALGLVFALAVTAAAHERPEVPARGPCQVSVNETVLERLSTPVVPESLATGNHREVTQFVMDFDGDHSLDLATVVEQAIGTYSRYTVHLHLASGAEQSIAVTAPPGGLRLEMKDMTGDKVRNDLILRPALVHWLPTVLVNDGHDHFAVVISNHFPDFLSCGQDLQPRENDARASATLLSSGFKARGFQTSGVLFPPSREVTLALGTQSIVPRWDLSSNSGRAPPSVLTSL
jgi:hypothetical protein